MAHRFARAFLALLCAVAVIYGTAMFPAAFDVELRSDQPTVESGPTAPGDSTPRDTGDTVTPTGTDSDSDSTGSSADNGQHTATPTASPPATPTETPAGGGSDSSADGDSGAGAGSDWFLGASVLGLCAVVGLTLRYVAQNGEGSSSLLSWLQLPAIELSLPLASLSFPSLSLHRIPQVTTVMILSAGGGLARLADQIGTVTAAISRTLFSGIGPVAGIVGRSLVVLPRISGSLLVAPLRSLGTAGSLFGGLGFLSGGLSRPGFGGSDTPSGDARTETGPTPEAVVAEDEAVTSVIEAWTAMTSLFRVRNPESTTAAEYARLAVEAGLPSTPVERLTALFREVRYGGHPDSDTRVAAALAALDALTGGDSDVED